LTEKPLSHKDNLQKDKKKRRGKKILSFFLALIIVWMAIYLLPPFTKLETPFDELDRPLVIAHQGGEHLAPSNTLASFKNGYELGADVLEFDIHMTKDGHLVAIHDDTVDRTTDGSGRVNDMTLEEIKELDAGHYFEDLDGKYSFRGKGLEIPTIEEIFKEIPGMKWNIEIKDSNDPDLYKKIVEKYWKTLTDYDLVGDVLTASFDQDIIDLLMEESDGEAFVSGGRQEITKFAVLHFLLLNRLYKPYVNAIQIPTEDGGINLKSKLLIKGAQKIGMDVHYWTINDPDLMRELIDLGADGLITDRPDLMIELLEE